jgi:hypothetical protein
MVRSRIESLEKVRQIEPESGNDAGLLAVS